ncbi:MAG: 16S rRNA (cytidine(1402)-2'-O)-methyltransferase [Deltaproteobacteria bacterium]|nr:16S rRNA (cytidine(1402)-2'-O)-methyltransferase [Deltaproteobacteria bacterium]
MEGVSPLGAKLYVVATPIGNLEDITMRGLRVLKEADVIAAEDTRHTKKLLAHFGIKTPLTSCFEHNERGKSVFLIAKLKDGTWKKAALVTDAGTPGISDPGYRLIKFAIENGIAIVPVPGPSALITLLTVSGLPLDTFTFKGFVPTGALVKRRFFIRLKNKKETYVMYESPRRLKDTLDVIHETLGDVHCVIGREMTKLHEEILRGTVSAVKALLEDRVIKGEVTLAIRTEESSQPFEEGITIPDELKKLLAAGLSVKDAVKAVTEATGRPRGEVYNAALRIRAALK